MVGIIHVCVYTYVHMSIYKNDILYLEIEINIDN